MNIKISRYLALVVFSCAVAGLVGCSHFKSSAGDASQTAGMSDPDGFGEYGFSMANRLKAPYNQSYYFDFDRYEAKNEDLESIQIQANYLVSHPQARIRLEGNADERGSREYNVALGWKRAKAVASVLKQHGATDAQIAVVSYGKEKPLALGHDEDSHSQNRRVDLIYEAK